MNNCWMATPLLRNRAVYFNLSPLVVLVTINQSIIHALPFSESSKHDHCLVSLIYNCCMLISWWRSFTFLWFDYFPSVGVKIETEELVIFTHHTRSSKQPHLVQVNYWWMVGHLARSNCTLLLLLDPFELSCLLRWVCFQVRQLGKVQVPQSVFAAFPDIMAAKDIHSNYVMGWRVTFCCGWKRCGSLFCEDLAQGSGSRTSCWSGRLPAAENCLHLLLLGLAFLPLKQSLSCHSCWWSPWVFSSLPFIYLNQVFYFW